MQEEEKKLREEDIDDTAEVSDIWRPRELE